MKIRFETDRLRDEIVFGEDDDDGDGRARRMGNVSGARARVGARSGSGRFAYARYGRRRAGPPGRARASRRVRTFRAPFSRVPVRRHFDVVKVHRREKGPRERASAEARGRSLREAPGRDARRGRREGDEARDDGLAGRRAERARPLRSPAPRAGKGGKARMVAAGQISGREARTFSFRDARVPKARALASPFPWARARAALWVLRACAPRALVCRSARAAERERVSFPLRPGKKHARSAVAFRKYPREHRRFAVAFDAAFDRRRSTATVRGSVSSARSETSRLGSGTGFHPGFRPNR